MNILENITKSFVEQSQEILGDNMDMVVELNKYAPEKVRMLKKK